MAREEESRRWHTFHGAALPLQKKFPSFKEFVKPMAPRTDAHRQQTGGQQLQTFRALLERRKRKP